jgi:hypothetical protein
MSCVWTDEPACKRVRVSNLLNSLIMLDGATLPDLDIDDLAMAASDLLDQYRKRGMDDVIHRKLVGRALDAEYVEKRKDLIAKIEAAIQEANQAYDADVAAAQVALAAPALAYLVLPFLQIWMHHCCGIKGLSFISNRQRRKEGTFCA